MKKALVPFVAFLLLMPALAGAEPYIRADQVDFTHLLPAPPALDTGVGQRDLAEVLRTRGDADDDERARAIADGEVSIFRFADVLGPRFRERRLPKTIAFFQHVAQDTRPLNSSVKAHWHRDRPFVADPNVHSPKSMIDGVCNDRRDQPGSTPIPECPSGVSYSYPSGHSTFGVLTAILLAEMVPEKRDQLLARGWEYGRARVVNGMHFPTDVEAGRIAATVMVALMMQSGHFRADLADAKAELRAVLGLAPRVNN